MFSHCHKMVLKEIYGLNKWPPCNDKYTSNDFEKLLRESDNFVISVLSSCKEGISVDDLKTYFGIPYLNRFENYVKKRVLVKKNGRFFLKNKIKENCSLTKEGTYQMVSNLINNHYKVENFGIDKNNIFFSLLSWVDPDHEAIKTNIPALTKKYIEDVTREINSALGYRPL